MKHNNDILIIAFYILPQKQILLVDLSVLYDLSILAKNIYQTVLYYCNSPKNLNLNFPTSSLVKIPIDYHHSDKVEFSLIENTKH